MSRPKGKNNINTVIGITALDSILLDKLLEGLKTIPEGSQKAVPVTRKAWASGRICEAFIEAFGVEEYQRQRRAWVDAFLGNPSAPGNDF